MRIGVFGTSTKENEKRIAIYPEHLNMIDPGLRRCLYFERGYGRPFGFGDEFFVHSGSNLAEREALFSECDILLLPKPMEADLLKMKERQVLWGWVHCVQQRTIAQIAIDRRLTYVAWEAMHSWSPHGEKLMHIFYKNNELAGYASVMHVCQLRGINGHYGPRRKVAVVSHGSVSRGAIYGLNGLGFNNIHVYTRRPVHLVEVQNPDVYYHHMFREEDGELSVRLNDGRIRKLTDELSEADIICNGILQDTNDPLIFITSKQLSMLKDRTVIIDISCDEGMGFEFAKPTTFEAPIIEHERGIAYYSVDHTPTYLWDAASREISRALIPYLNVLFHNQFEFEADLTLKKAIEIKNGIILNENILRFQKRSVRHPYDPM